MNIRQNLLLLCAALAAGYGVAQHAEVDDYLSAFGQAAVRQPFGSL